MRDGCDLGLISSRRVVFTANYPHLVNFREQDDGAIADTIVDLDYDEGSEITSGSVVFAYTAIGPRKPSEAISEQVGFIHR